ncbi:iron complex outermembrane recepter protein [Methylomarinovum tepidoasis]|uniref:Iron complex outermembrane recepter protein n=1 Tax=Methylomarinovum tepidoasis TaxID=2840183 RepID=A0AAU9CH78_9GAMM|nr:TonB-dependent receptor [Methylomarinovum sp. IN45]BCX89648.1 iron complex outermembrane recepter protein [Methylomarinovum sp. IN45]
MRWLGKWLLPWLMIPFAALAESVGPELSELPLEDLLKLEVTSVSKKTQALTDAPAAIFVITQEDIRHSGATHVADLLRMVPGMDVARIDANKWAVNARGFNGRFANKLLVLIDGRSIYTPTFSGVYWEAIDLILEDIERIEVIRGPGAALWGVNAVNGVINIITRHAADTQGGLAFFGGGSELRGFGGARYGFRLGDKNYGRVYIKGTRHDDLVRADGGSAGDDWSIISGGLRMDFHPGANDTLMLQGHAYGGDIDQGIYTVALAPPDYTFVQDHATQSGWHVLTRWQHVLSPSSELRLQAFYDHSERDEIIMEQVNDVVDLDLQHQFNWGGWNDIVWGLEYRYTKDALRPPMNNFRLSPVGRDTHLASAFLQDQITLVPRALWLTLGSRLSHNTFTGFEIQPTARLLWAFHPKHRLWAAISRAVRTPSRSEEDTAGALTLGDPLKMRQNLLPLPLLVSISGNRNLRPEKLLAYELGYRFLPAPEMFVDLALFYHDYDDLVGQQPQSLRFQGTYVELPLRFANVRTADLYGLELAAGWQPAQWLRSDLAYTFLHTDIDTSKEGKGTQVEKSPRHQVSLQIRTHPWKAVDFDAWFRYVSPAEALFALDSRAKRISRYFALDLRLAWHPVEALELSVVGRNLVNSRHLEYVQENFVAPTEVQRSVYGRLKWCF